MLCTSILSMNVRDSMLCDECVLIDTSVQVKEEEGVKIRLNGKLESFLS